jgi:hypothetical protein
VKDIAARIATNIREDGRAIMGGNPVLWPWFNPQRINAVDKSYMGPNACLVGSEIYLFWRSADMNNAVYYSKAVYSALTWPAGTRIANFSTVMAPASCAVPQGSAILLFLAHAGAVETSLSKAPPGWSPPGPIESASSYLSPSAFTYQDTPYCFWVQDDTADSQIYYSVGQKDETWSKGLPVPGAVGLSAPAAVLFNDAIYLFFQALDSHVYFVRSPDGHGWNAPQLVSGASTAASAPTACVVGNTILVLWQDTSGAIMSTSCTSQLNWSSAVAVPNAAADHAPSVVNYYLASNSMNYTFLFWTKGFNIYFSLKYTPG